MNEAQITMISAVSALLIAVGSVAGQVLSYLQKQRAEKNKPQVDDSQADLNEANAAKTMGEAWDALFAKLEKRVNEQDEIIRRQGETIKTSEEIIRRQGETIRSLMSSMDKDKAEKEILARENAELRDRVSEQEKEIASLRDKVEKLEKERNG